MDECYNLAKTANDEFGMKKLTYVIDKSRRKEKIHYLSTFSERQKAIITPLILSKSSLLLKSSPLPPSLTASSLTASSTSLQQYPLPVLSTKQHLFAVIKKIDQAAVSSYLVKEKDESLNLPSSSSPSPSSLKGVQGHTELASAPPASELLKDSELLRCVRRIVVNCIIGRKGRIVIAATDVEMLLYAQRVLTEVIDNLSDTNISIDQLQELSTTYPVTNVPSIGDSGSSEGVSELIVAPILSKNEIGWIVGKGSRHRIIAANDGKHVHFFSSKQQLLTKVE
jgi:hypothetical protein